MYSKACTVGAVGSRIGDWLLPRVLELAYTAWDLNAFAEDCGDTWLPIHLGCRAAFPTAAARSTRPFSTLYGISRDDTAYILDAFPVLKQSEESEYGEYRDEARGA